MSIDVKHQQGGISFYLVNYVLMIYVFTKLRVDIHRGKCNLSLERGLLTFRNYLLCFGVFYIYRFMSVLEESGDFVAFWR